MRIVLDLGRLSWEGIESEDISFARCIRLSFRVVLAGVDGPGEMCFGRKLEAETAILHMVRGKGRRLINALNIFFYRTGDDIHQRATLGCSEWAPEGRWSMADQVQAGDYSRHRWARL